MCSGLCSQRRSHHYFQLIERTKERSEDRQVPLKNVTRKLNTSLPLTSHWSESSHVILTSLEWRLGILFSSWATHVPFQNCAGQWGFITKRKNDIEKKLVGTIRKSMLRPLQRLISCKFMCSSSEILVIISTFR